MIAAFGIPIFYVSALFYTSTTNYTIADTWRFWIIHLWVEGFFELFATVMVAIIYFLLGIVSRKTAARFIEWARIVPDLIFGVAGVLPIVIAAGMTYWMIRKTPAKA